MPPTGYLTASGIESCLVYLANTYPAVCQLIVLPETSVEGRTIRAIKIAHGGGDRHGVLLIGGVHAREIVNPDLLVTFALKLCQAYSSGTGLSFGGKSYSSSTVQLIVNSMDLFIFPLVNPDGRIYVQSPTGDPWWRKNRNPNPGAPCKGIDLNRNYEFLWSSGIGTSSGSCSEVFKGAAAFSEPETRNVRFMLDNYPHIRCMVDVHSYMQLILHPWGDDTNQTSDPAMNFMNPMYNGLRGNPSDSSYKEFIPQSDLGWFVSTANRVRDAISAVRGRVYTVEQAVLLYPTSGTSKDYAYSRHFVDATKRRVFAYTIETGTEFQPNYSEASNIISEVSSGLIEFCMSCLCVIEETTHGTTLVKELARIRAFRDKQLEKFAAGHRYVRLLEDNTSEVLQALSRDDKLMTQVAQILQRVNRKIQSIESKKPETFDDELVGDMKKLFELVGTKGSPSLKTAVKEVVGDLQYFRGKTVLEGLSLASQKMDGKRAKARKRK